MEWVSGLNLTSLPWWAVFVIALLTFAATKGVDGLIRWRRSRLDERQYDDGQIKAGYEALIEELRNRIVKIESDFHGVMSELRDTRAAHTRCEIEQEKLRGQVAVLQEKVMRLEAHDERGAKHIEGLKEAVKEIDPVAATKVP